MCGRMVTSRRHTSRVVAWSRHVVTRHVVAWSRHVVTRHVWSHGHVTLSHVMWSHGHVTSSHVMWSHCHITLSHVMWSHGHTRNIYLDTLRVQFVPLHVIGPVNAGVSLFVHQQVGKVHLCTCERPKRYTHHSVSGGCETH